MADPITTAELTRRLAIRHRVLLLGGLAVISHGHPRSTFDADIWLDPNLSADLWIAAVLKLRSVVPTLTVVDLGKRATVEESGLAEVVERDGVVRLLGASQPLDVFRVANELPVGEFDAVWERARVLDDGTRLPDTIDLLVTKQATGRAKDLQDIVFLEAKAEREYLERLPTAGAAQAAAMLDRFLTPKVAEAALTHSAPSVRDLARRFLRELADDGDPFARDILAGIGKA